MSTAEALQILDFAVGPNDDELEAAVATVRLALAARPALEAPLAKVKRKAVDPLAKLWKAKPSRHSRANGPHPEAVGSVQRHDYLRSFGDPGSPAYQRQEKRLAEMRANPKSQFDFESPKAGMKDDARLTFVTAYLSGAGAA